MESNFLSKNHITCQIFSRKGTSVGNQKERLNPQKILQLYSVYNTITFNPIFTILIFKIYLLLYCIVYGYNQYVQQSKPNRNVW